MEAGPVLLEPIMSLKVTVPDAYTGDIMGDLNKRRGRVLGMTPMSGGRQIIEADIPMNLPAMSRHLPMYRRRK